MTAEQFHEILVGLTSSDNDLRGKAEAAYEEFPITDRFTHLMEVVSILNGNDEIRQLSAVLMRRIVTSNYEEAYIPLAPELQQRIREQLLFTLKSEPNNVMRRKLGDFAAELARKHVDDDGKNHWPEILKFLFECISSNDVGLKEITLHIFCQYSGIFGNQQAHYQDVLRQMLEQSMQDEQPPQVSFLAARAAVAFLIENESNTQLLRHYQDLLPGILKATMKSASDGDDEVLKSLVELCEDIPKYIRPRVADLLTMCLKLIGDVEIEESIRQLALEVIVTLAETVPGLIRKQKTYISQIIPQTLALMVDLEDEDPTEWANSEDTEEDECDTNPVAGENALDRLACALGGQAVLPHILATVPAMLQNPDWRYRHGGLMAISAVGEGCHKYMEEILSEIVGVVIPYLGDSHPRVRYAACNAVGQMCTDFAPTMQKSFHEKIIVGLCEVLNDDKNPKVQGHAAAALVNFIEECPKGTMILYLDPLCSKLEQVLNSKIQELLVKKTKLVLEQITTTIAAVADRAEEKFNPYYDRLMPSLKYIMENANGDEFRMLRGKTIECISLIGLAVGSEKFMNDAQSIMNQLLKAQADIESWEDDDPQVSYMMSAWARMCKLLGQDFVQYLPIVMAPLMKAAGIRPEVAMMDSQDADVVEEDEGWEFIKMGDQRSFGIKTTGMEQKATACQMLVCYARELKEGFANYAEEVVKLMVPLLKFFFHDGVRASAAESLPLLMECASLRGDEYVAQMWGYIAPNILEAVSQEPDADVMPMVMEALAKCIELRGHGCFTMEQYQELAKTLNSMLEKHFTRAQERQEKRKDEDYDEEVEETLQDEDEEDVYILSKIADILHSLFGTHRDELFPFFDSILPHYIKLLGPDQPWPDRQWSLCVFDDIVEYAGAASLKYKDIFLRPLLAYLTDKNAEVRQASSYGIGVMAMFAGEAYADAIKEALPILQAVIEGPLGKGVEGPVLQENIGPMENCISAVCKVLKYQPHLIDGDKDELLRRWLSWLPVVEDKEEATHVYSFLCELIENNNAVVLGPNSSEISRAIVLLSDAIFSGALSDSEEVTNHVISIMRRIQSSASDVWMNVLSQLPPVKTKAVLSILEDHQHPA
ncbi:importin-5-like [Styela clava]